MMLIKIYSGNVAAENFKIVPFPGISYIPNTPSDLEFIVGPKSAENTLGVGLYSLGKDESLDLEVNWSNLKASAQKTLSDKVTSWLDFSHCTFIVEIIPTQPDIHIPDALLEGMELSGDNGRTASIGGFNPMFGTLQGKRMTDYVSTPDARKGK